MRIRSRLVVVVLTATTVAVVGGGGSQPGTVSAYPAIADPIVVTHDGGLYVLDGTTLRNAADVPLAGFNELDPAGDDRHVIVSAEDGFRVLDTIASEFTGVEFPGHEPGHVVRHGGRTALFTDGTGDVTVIDPAELSGGAPVTETYRTAEPHHGVAVPLTDGELIVTLGTETTRTGIMVLDRDRHEITRNEDCPGAHGAATAPGEAVVIGCENGALMYRDGAIIKMNSPTAYGAITTLTGSTVSPIVLGNFAQNPNAELERPQQISLIDTTTDTLRPVDLGTSYSFRSPARGPHGEAVVLGTDGRIYVIDPATATVTRTIPVIAPWEKPVDWKQPRPTLFVRADVAYVSEPATRQLYRIDLATGIITTTVTVPDTPNVLSGVTDD
ncbi:zinc metallochaperone AztD [Nocardia sp. 2YAB30]|uniref:zinc metallochaperone AztD n=1 Tax=unclassified Nocardia TaxID=2637762 RepID=UPI003F991263